MSTVILRKGHDIRVAGRAERVLVDAAPPKRVALLPTEFRGIRPRLSVEVGQQVRLGTPLFTDKVHPEIRFVSPAAGSVVATNRGARRVLTEVVIELGDDEPAEELPKYDPGSVSQCSREQLLQALLQGGLWGLLKQRPFGKIPNPEETPKSVFVQGIDTEPLALDPAFVLEGQEEAFQAGLDALTRLTDGPVRLCVQDGADLPRALSGAQRVEIHRFRGPHPAGNPGTHIHFLDPVRQGEVVWYLKAVEVSDIGHLLLSGRFPTERIVALAGPAVSRPCYVRTRVGAPMQALTQGRIVGERVRYVSGTVLNGASVGAEGFLRFGDRTVTVLPEGGGQQFLAWARPGLGKYSVSRTYPSGFCKGAPVALDTSLHGGHRAIVDLGQYDAVMPLNLMPVPLVKSILAGDLDEAEKLGLLELAEEDLALCSFVCPSKIDFGDLLRQGLELYEKEG
jgi:Na+-transporting NADH:ubiquinone oxidoreductase subunit A